MIGETSKRPSPGIRHFVGLRGEHTCGRRTPPAPAGIQEKCGSAGRSRASITNINQLPKTGLRRGIGTSRRSSQVPRASFRPQEIPILSETSARVRRLNILTLAPSGTPKGTELIVFYLFGG